MTKLLYWFTHDLRLQDNLTLSALLRQGQQLAWVYVIDPSWFKANNYQQKTIGQHRFQFISQALIDIQKQLAEYGHSLTILEGEPSQQIINFIKQHNIQRLGCAKQFGWHEQQAYLEVKQQLPNLEMVSLYNSTLFDADQLDLQSSTLNSFTSFRKYIEQNNIQPAVSCKIWLDTLPQPLLPAQKHTDFLQQLNKYLVFSSKHKTSTISTNANTGLFCGGEHAAQQHLEHYFSSQAPLNYKLTRNALDGWQSSTKFSPFLAQGNISPRQIWQRLQRYETCVKQNESTYWIGFELLWREYFQWLALQQKTQLFAFQGQANKRPLTSFYAERFIKWCQGNTPYPLVNACMRQLNTTGYMSNRGRQIVASCLVNELAIDWRFGAAYFQQQLIDYDVAANWGNWQYIAGVGVDPRGGRHFNIEKQSKLYDPDASFTLRWQGEVTATAIDSIDAADWPIIV